MIKDREVEQTKGFFHNFWHDYSSFLPGVNWRNFCFVHLGVEWDHMLGRVEWEGCLLGLWYRGVYVYDDQTPMQQELRERIQQLDAGSPYQERGSMEA